MIAHCIKPFDIVTDKLSDSLSCFLLSGVWARNLPNPKYEEPLLLLSIQLFDVNSWKCVKPQELLILLFVIVSTIGTKSWRIESKIADLAE